MMKANETTNEQSLTQILYALVLAIAPFIESLVAQAQAEGRPISPALRSLARTIASLRLAATLFSKNPNTPTPATPTTPKPRPANRPQPPSATTTLIPNVARLDTLIPAPPHPLRL